MPNILQLPAEILIKVLSHLPGIDVESCKLINRDVREIISSSALLCYLIAADLSGVEDNPRSQLSLSEKLTVLTERELSWRKFKPDFIRSISVDHPTSGISDFTDGAYVIGALNRPWLHCLELPTISSQVPAWSRLQVDPHHTIINIALAIYESDLIAIVTSAPDSNLDEMFRIELNFRSFKSGKAHPLAQQPTIPIGVPSQTRPSISIEVVGDFVALVVTRWLDVLQSKDQVLVWNWKTGAPLMSVNAAYRVYQSLMFLTEDILLVPNAVAATFELWRIPPSSDNDASRHPTQILGLPPLAVGMQFGGISCWGEPNPLGPCSTLDFDRPFRASPQQAIIIFHIHIDALLIGSRFTLTLVVHRRSLVDLIHKHPRISSKGARRPLPWADWGPSLTRWFVCNGSSDEEIASAGQRFAFISSARVWGPVPITIYDFNPHNVAKMKNYLRHHSNPNMSWSDREEELESVSILFQDRVRSALPYCCTKTEGLYTYSSVLMDEETLVGIKEGRLGRIEAVDIMHFG